MHLLRLFDENFELLLSAAVPYSAHVLVHGYNQIVEIIWMPQSQPEYSSPHTPNSGFPNSTDIILRVETSEMCVWSHPLNASGSQSIVSSACRTNGTRNANLKN